jgi:predicted tellurium resistance membrane protein TerC
MTLALAFVAFIAFALVLNAVFHWGRSDYENSCCSALVAVAVAMIGLFVQSLT